MTCTTENDILEWAAQVPPLKIEEFWRPTQTVEGKVEFNEAKITEFSSIELEKNEDGNHSDDSGMSTDIGEDDDWDELDCSWGSDAGKPTQRKVKPVDDHDGELQSESHSVFLTHNTGTWSCPDVAVRTNSSITVPRPPASDDAIGEACRSAISAEGAACGSTILQ